MIQQIAQFSFIGWPLAILGVILLVLAVVLVRKQKTVEVNSSFDDPDDDPDVQSLSSKGRLVLWGAIIFGLIGAVLIVSPAWANVF